MGTIFSVVNLDSGAILVNGIPLTFITNYVGVSAAGSVASIAALRLVTVKSVPSYSAVVLDGYYAPGDGGGGVFYYDASSVATDDGGSVIAPSVGAGRWIRPPSSSINPRWFGAKGDAITDDSAAFQNAVYYAISSRCGLIQCDASEYYIASTVNLINQGGSVFTGGVHIRGAQNNAVGAVTRFTQGVLNTPIFNVASIAVRISCIAFTCTAGANVNLDGTPITALSHTANSITFSTTSWPTRPPVIWTPTTPLISTDGTSYANAIRFNCQGAWVGSSFTNNGNGTFTINGVKGAEGTLNASISGVDTHEIALSSLAHSINPATLSANAGIIYVSIHENQFYDHLWFNQVTHAFNYSALGSGSGPGVGNGEVGFMSHIVVDQGMSLILGQGDIDWVQLTQCQLYGIYGYAFDAAGNFLNSQISGSTQFAGARVVRCVDMDRVIIEGCGIGLIQNLGYCDGSFNVSGTISNCAIVGNIIGRNTGPVFIFGIVDGLQFTGNQAISTSEGGNLGLISVTGAYFINSYIGANSFVRRFTSGALDIKFTNTACNTTGTKIGQIVVTNLVVRLMIEVDTQPEFIGPMLVSTADALHTLKVSGASGKIRITGFADATNGGVIDATNPGEGALTPLTVSASDLRFGSTSPIWINQSPGVAAAVVSTHKLALNLNGTTYYMLLTNVP